MADVFKWLSATFAALMTLALPAAAQAYVNEQDGPYMLQLSAPGGGGYVEAVVHDTETQLIAQHGGKCQTDASVMLVIMNGDILQTHFASGSAGDLKAEGLLQKMSELLERGCPEVETISVFLSHLPPDSPAIVIRKSDNWLGSDAPIAAPRLQQVRLSEVINSVAIPDGIPCNDPATILIDAGQSSNALRDYIRAAENGAKIHEILCPGTSSLRFELPAPPTGAACNAEDGDCYLSATWNPNISQANRRTAPRSGTREDLVARLREMTAIRASSEEWLVSAVGYGAKPQNTAPKILTFNDMIDHLARRDYELIRSDYNSYFRLFHNQFLFAFSEQCRAQIADPITFNVTLVEETVFGDGSSTGPRQVAPTYQLTLDRQFEVAYRRYATANKAWMTEQMVSYTLSADPARGGGSGVSAYVGKVMSDKEQIDALVRKGCATDRIQAVYQSLGDVL